jgi:hypothetical protein
MFARLDEPYTRPQQHVLLDIQLVNVAPERNTNPSIAGALHRHTQTMQRSAGRKRSVKGCFTKCTLDGSGGAEGPERSAGALVLHRCHCTLLTPVDRSRCHSFLLNGTWDAS